jgi:Ca-activated chloride channel family protein
MNGGIRGRVRTIAVVRTAPFLFWAFTSFAYAQDAADTVIRVDAPLVVLHASVRSGSGRMAAGLQQRHFKVTEDGAPQTIRSFHSEDMPIAVGLVVDNSGSMRDKLGEVFGAASAFARSSNPDDSLFVVNFSDRAVFALPGTVLFTGSPAALEGAIRNPVPSGRTALYDAIRAALGHLGKSDAERKAMLVISDGGDNASSSTLNDVVKDILRSDATIYTLSLYDPEDRDHNGRFLRQMARISGGESFFPADAPSAMKACAEIARDLRSQYALSYSPTNENFDGARRAIRVTVSGDRGEKFKVRTRTAYIASPAPKDDRR